MPCRNDGRFCGLGKYSFCLPILLSESMLLSESYATVGTLSSFRLRSGYVRTPLLLLSVLSESRAYFEGLM